MSTTRSVATFREDDTDPKEEFVYHVSGDGGFGGSSYIDLVVLRDKDANTAWTTTSDGTLEERIYYCQNWRADVVALVDSAGQQLEGVRYSAYGVPFGLPGGDADSDGDCDSTDVSVINTWWFVNPTTYDIRGDIDLDGDVDSSDESLVSTGTSCGRGVLASVPVSNRCGFSGYKQLALHEQLWDVRNRILVSELGEWNRRDPGGYADGQNLYEPMGSSPTNYFDSLGTTSIPWFIPCPGKKSIKVPANCNAGDYPTTPCHKLQSSWLSYIDDLKRRLSRWFICLGPSEECPLGCEKKTNNPVPPDPNGKVTVVCGWDPTASGGCKVSQKNDTFRITFYCVCIQPPTFQ